MHAPRAVWRDTFGAFRRCRETLQQIYPGLSARVVAHTLDRDPAWLSRIEGGHVGPSVPNVALLVGAYFGLLHYTYPTHLHTLHTFMPDLPLPAHHQPRDVPRCAATFCWHIQDLRSDVGRARGTVPMTIRELTTGAQLHNEILAALEAEQSAGSIQTLRAVYTYLCTQLTHALVLDDVLTIPATAHLVTPACLARIAKR